MSAPLPAPANHDPDADLVRLAREGRYDAFEQLVGRHERTLYNLALRIVRQAHDAEDVVQQTFLSAIENLAGFAERSQFRTWLIRVATNHALKMLRKRRGLPTVALGTDEDDSAPLPHPEFIAPWREEPGKLAQDRETQELIADAMEKLGDKYKLVFLLRDIHELSVEETAQALDITPANVKVRLLRARLMLRERLTQVLGDPDRQVTGHRHED